MALYLAEISQYGIGHPTELLVSQFQEPACLLHKQALSL